MQQKIIEFMANLLDAGLSRDKIVEKAYEYALVLQDDELSTDNMHSVFMLKASEFVRDAMPEAQKLHSERCRVEPVPIALDSEIARENRA